MWHNDCESAFRRADIRRTFGCGCACALNIILYGIVLVQAARSDDSAVNSPNLPPSPRTHKPTASLFRGHLTDPQVNNEGDFAGEPTPAHETPKSNVAAQPPPSDTHHHTRSRSPLKVLTSALSRLSQSLKSPGLNSDGETSQEHSTPDRRRDATSWGFESISRRKNQPRNRSALHVENELTPALDQSSKELMKLKLNGTVACNGHVRTTTSGTHHERVTSSKKMQSSPSHPPNSRSTTSGKKRETNVSHSTSMCEREVRRFHPHLPQMPTLNVNVPPVSHTEPQLPTSSPIACRARSQSTGSTLKKASPRTNPVRSYNSTSAVGEAPAKGTERMPVNSQSRSRPIPVMQGRTVSGRSQAQWFSIPDVTTKAAEQESTTDASGEYHSASPPSCMKHYHVARRSKPKQSVTSVDKLVASSIATMLIPASFTGELPTPSDSGAQQRTPPGAPPLTTDCSPATIPQEQLPAAHGGSHTSSSVVQTQCTVTRDAPGTPPREVKVQSTSVWDGRGGKPLDAHDDAVVQSDTPHRLWLDRAVDGVQETAPPNVQSKTSTAPPGLLPAKKLRYRMAVAGKPIPVRPQLPHSEKNYCCTEDIYVPMAPLKRNEEIYVPMDGLKAKTHSSEGAYVNLDALKTSPLGDGYVPMSPLGDGYVPMSPLGDGYVNMNTKNHE